MSDNVLNDYGRLTAQANEYHKKALWQETLRILQEIQTLCETGTLSDSDQRTQDVLSELGAIRRRLGQYGAAEDLLNQALAASSTSDPLKRASILGELTVVLRHANKFEEALSASTQQYELAKDAEPRLETDVEQCRAIGNAGMCTYNITQNLSKDDPAVTKLLSSAVAQLQERIDRAQKLQLRLLTEPNPRFATMAKAWETIGLDRLTLVYIVQGRNKEALDVAKQSQSKQTSVDPTVKGYSSFYYGYALWSNGMHDEALATWNVPSGTCSPPMVFCKEPAREHNEYIRLMADAGVNFDSFDEQGFSALDYAALSDNSDAADAIPMIIKALETSFDRHVRRQHPEYGEDERHSLVQEKIGARRRQAEVRRQYRNLFQENMRPKLGAQQTQIAQRSVMKSLRKVYNDFIISTPQSKRMLWPFHFVKYADFKSHGRLPSSSDGVTCNDVSDTGSDFTDAFVIFFSYRWRGGAVPDDQSSTQWRRMVDAVEHYLEVNPDISRYDIAIWLDYACIDQVDLSNKLRGVDSLPIAVTLCDAMISLVDDSYYERAWCAVEVILADTLFNSYGMHKRWEHVYDSSGSVLRNHNTERTLETDHLKLTNEVEDRPKIDFLIRQSKLIGRDPALAAR